MDLALCSPKRPNPTCVLLAHGTVCSSSMCILMGMEQLGKDDLKLSMKCGINISACLMQCVQVVILHMQIPSSLQCASFMEF